MDVENAPSEKREKSEVRSRATTRVLVHAESWQRHPAAAARRWVFVTFFPSRHYLSCSVTSREVILALHSSHRSRLGACGNLATTACRPVVAVGVRHEISNEALHFPYFRASVQTNKIGVFEWNYDSTSGLVDWNGLNKE
ncbi:hypothetical protein TNIN_103791 [Trichonephila inaurata madagascariensis]|uniref:Uncharacterized protein n=1 Tax=Trichonephila inaurata madagascariensis TaxID=2747483 RepID=A0A8X6X964_9ARAC|nr:hypothetical protein TNIN_103791 [Trichonephila inaurata madagascariensis]